MFCHFWHVLSRNDFVCKLYAALTHALTHAALTHALTHAALTHAALTHAALTHAALTHASWDLWSSNFDASIQCCQQYTTSYLFELNCYGMFNFIEYEQGISIYYTIHFNLLLHYMLYRREVCRCTSNGQWHVFLPVINKPLLIACW